MAKSPEAFRTISEAADELGVAQHVLRFWESRLTFIRPMKRAGGRRFYRPGDIAVLEAVRRLLREEGYSIRGVQALHHQGGFRPPAPATAPAAPTVSAISHAPRALTAEARARLHAALANLTAAQARLDGLLASR